MSVVKNKINEINKIINDLFKDYKEADRIDKYFINYKYKSSRQENLILDSLARYVSIGTKNPMSGKIFCSFLLVEEKNLTGRQSKPNIKELLVSANNEVEKVKNFISIISKSLSNGSLNSLFEINYEKEYASIEQVKESLHLKETCTDTKEKRRQFATISSKLDKFQHIIKFINWITDNSSDLEWID